MSDRFIAEKRKTHQEKLASAGCGTICQTDQVSCPVGALYLSCELVTKP